MPTGLLGSVEQAAYKWAFKHGPLHQANPAETSQHLRTRERITLALLLLRYPPPSGDPQTGQQLNCIFWVPVTHLLRYNIQDEITHFVKCKVLNVPDCTVDSSKIMR